MNRRLVRAALARSADLRGRFWPRLERLEDRTLLTTGFFVLDESQSVLNLSGNVFGAPFQEQEAGSLTTSYSGTLVVDFDVDKGTISFSPDGSAAAGISGDWQPRPNGQPGAAPANYGGQVQFLGTALAAVRGLVATAFTAEPAALAPTGKGTWEYPSTQTMAITAGTVDWSHPLLRGGSSRLANRSGDNAAGSGTLRDLGDGSFELTVPVDVTVEFNISILPTVAHIEGMLVGLHGPGRAPESGPRPSPDAAASFALPVGNHALADTVGDHALGSLNRIAFSDPEKVYWTTPVPEAGPEGSSLVALPMHRTVAAPPPGDGDGLAHAPFGGEEFRL